MLYTTTTTAARAVNNDSRMDFAGELMDEKIPNATPVFLTYVMLRKPSITEVDSFSVNLDWINALVQRSKNNVKTTSKTYGIRDWNFDAIFENYIGFSI